VPVGWQRHLLRRWRLPFSLFNKYGRIALFLLTYAWYANVPDQACVYALRYDEAKRVADQMGGLAQTRGVGARTRPRGRPWAVAVSQPTGPGLGRKESESELSEPQAK
jgi:hypothetical protein